MFASKRVNLLCSRASASIFAKQQFRFYAAAAPSTGLPPHSAYTEIIDDDANELGDNFNFDDYLRLQEEKRREAPARVGSFTVKPSISQVYNPRLAKNPYKLDKHLKPLYDFSKLNSFDSARYPAIDIDHVYQGKKPRYEYTVKTEEEIKGKFEFRKNISSEQLLAANCQVAKDSNKTHLVSQIFSWKNSSARELRKLKTQETIARLQHHPSDTANPAIQVALITQRIQAMTAHLKKSRKDIPTARKLQKLMHRRKRMLQYLRRKDAEMYWKTLHMLDMRVPL